MFSFLTGWNWINLIGFTIRPVILLFLKKKTADQKARVRRKEWPHLLFITECSEIRWLSGARLALSFYVFLVTILGCSVSVDKTDPLLGKRKTNTQKRGPIGRSKGSLENRSHQASCKLMDLILSTASYAFALYSRELATRSSLREWGNATQSKTNWHCNVYC